MDSQAVGGSFHLHPAHENSSYAALYGLLKMRVLHLLEATGGGTARHIIDLCHGQALKGIEVHLIYSPLRIDPIMQKGIPRLQDVGVRLFELPMRRPPHPTDVGVLLKLRKYLSREGSFDIVHGHSSKGGAYARLLRLLGGPKAVYTPHAFVTWATWITPLERFIYGLIERILSYLTAAIIVSSEVEGNEGRCLGIGAHRIRLVHHGVSLNTATTETRKSVRSSLSIEDDMIAIGFVGRFAPQKAPNMILQSFSMVSKQFPNSRLIMIGDGPLDASLKEMSTRLNIEHKVFWPGFIDGRVVMRGFDVLVLPSAYESFGYVLFEAMAEGLPIVATKVGGTELAINEGENGFVVPVGDTSAFSAALSEILADQNKRKQFGINSKANVVKFTIENMVNKTIDTYRSLL